MLSSNPGNEQSLWDIEDIVTRTNEVSMQAEGEFVG